MCDTCGCSNESKRGSIDLKESLFARNREIGWKNRQYVEKRGATLINLISAPGSGKTSLLEATIKSKGLFVNSGMTIGVIEGDIETERDAERIRAAGAEAIQITTGGACHLDAQLVHKALHRLFEKRDHYDFIFIENVGNLVCPSSFYLGEHLRCVLVSVPEGSDKPAKYPTAFKDAQIFIITKVDLLPYFDFSMEEAKREARRINPSITIVEVSSLTGHGIDQWFHVLGIKKCQVP